MMNDRFILQPSSKPGFWVATDKVNGIVVTFRENRFTDTQKVTLLGDDTHYSTSQAMPIPTALRELADWLRREHYNVAMPSLIVQRSHLGQAIRSIRTQRGMTQQELADASGLTKANVCSIEAGKYSVGLDVLNRIANALGVSVELR